jgi:hypothetical protein
MTEKIPPAVSDYMAKIGAVGGKSGKGKSKARSAAHYKKLVEIRRKNLLSRR